MSSAPTQAIKQTLRQAIFFHGPTTIFSHSIADKIDAQFNGTISAQELGGLLLDSLASYQTNTDASHPLTQLDDIHYLQIRRELTSIANQIAYNAHGLGAAKEAAYACFANEVSEYLEIGRGIEYFPHEKASVRKAG